MTLTSVVDQALPLGNGPAVIAVDVGGTDTKAALFDEAGRMLGLSRTPTPHDGAGTALAVVTRVQELTRQFAADFPAVRPQAVGLLAPGVVDDEAGVGVLSANLHWSNVPFKQLTEDLVHLPTTFSHDVRAAGEAEFRLGAARPYQNVVVLVIGTGIAGSLFINGHAHTGGGYAGEIGHSIVAPDGPLCGCGARGCLESIASAGALVRRYTELTGIRPTGAREVLYDRCGDHLLCGPNDLVFDAHGGFYFTDFGKMYPRLRMNGGLYYGKADGSRIVEVAYPMINANGVGLSSDGSTVYVAETETGRLWAFDIETPGVIRRHGFPSPNGGRLLCGLPDFQRLDSMALQANGDICVATLIEACISVFSPAGKLLRQIPTGDPITTNICFGGPDMKTAYVTLAGTGQLVAIPWEQPGLRLHYG